MTAQLHAVATQFEEARDRTRALLAEVSDEAFNAKPSPTSWSVGECIVHLNTAAKAYVPVLEAALGPEAPRAPGPFRYGWLASWMGRSMRPGTPSVPTFPALRPPPTEGARSSVDRQRAVDRFETDLGRYLEVVRRADGYDLKRIKVASPFLSAFRLPLGVMLEFLAGHTLRHVGQAERAAAAAR